MRVASCVAIDTIQIANVSGAPECRDRDVDPRSRTLPGARKGRSRVSGSRKRSLMTASWAAVKASNTPKLKKPGEESHRLGRDEVLDHEQRGGDQRELT